MQIVVLSLLFAANDVVESAAVHLRAAQEAVQASPKSCNDALRVQIKAARMQLELSKEAKDPASAQSAIGGLRELAQEASQRCPPRVATEINQAIAALNGQPVDPDDDDDLKAEQTQGSSQPAAVPDTRAEPNKPFISPGTLPDLTQQVADTAKVLARGFTATGQTLRGYGKRTDWIQGLEAGKCYAFVGVGAPTTKRMALYLWDPSGRRQSDRRAREPIAVVYHCPFVSGPYHVQAKVKRPEGGYAVGVYVR